VAQKGAHLAQNAWLRATAGFLQGMGGQVTRSGISITEREESRARPEGRAPWMAVPWRLRLWRLELEANAEAGMVPETLAPCRERKVSLPKGQAS